MIVCADEECATEDGLGADGASDDGVDDGGVRVGNEGEGDIRMWWGVLRATMPLRSGGGGSMKLSGEETCGGQTIIGVGEDGTGDRCGTGEGGGDECGVGKGEGDTGEDGADDEGSAGKDGAGDDDVSKGGVRSRGGRLRALQPLVDGGWIVTIGRLPEDRLDVCRRFTGQVCPSCAAFLLSGAGDDRGEIVGLVKTTDGSVGGATSLAGGGNRGALAASHRAQIVRASPTTSRSASGARKSSMRAGSCKIALQMAKYG